MLSCVILIHNKNYTHACKIFLFDKKFSWKITEVCIFFNEKFRKIIYIYIYILINKKKIIIIIKCAIIILKLKNILRLSDQLSINTLYVMLPLIKLLQICDRKHFFI